MQSMWRRLCIGALWVGLSAIRLPSATQDSGSARFSVAVNLVKVPISVFDDRGHFVETLHKEHFRIWEDQSQQEIRSFGVETNAVSVVLLLDTSATGKPELKKIKSAAETFIGALDPADRVSLITFDDEVYLAQDWTDNKKKLKKALKKIDSGGRTALYDAMYLAAIEQFKGMDGRKAVILLTDCLNNQSRVDFEEAARAIVQSQASLYVVSKTAMVREQARFQRRVMALTDIYKRLFGEDDNYIEEFFRKREAQMIGLAEETGGRCFFPADYEAIRDIYAEVARELKSKYYLTYISNQTLSPDTYHRISIEYLKPASKIVHRKGYYYLPRMMHKNLLPGAAYGSFDKQ